MRIKNRWKLPLLFALKVKCAKAMLLGAMKGIF